MSEGSWCKLYHPKGCQVTVALNDDVSKLMAKMDVLFSQGWLVDAPGVEPGEARETVAAIVHGESEQNGETTPFLLLYSDNEAMKWSFVKVWLNHDKQVKEFELASGMKLDSIPLYIGQDKPERGKSKQIDKFIVPCPRPFNVVMKQNPKWSEEGAAAAKAKNEMYTVPKRVFVRWADLPTSAPSEPKADDGRSTYDKAADRISGGQPDEILGLLPLLGERKTEGKLTADEYSKLVLLAYETAIMKSPVEKLERFGEITAEAHSAGMINDKQLKQLVELCMSRMKKDELI